MQIQDLAKSYQTKTDEELVRLAMNLEQLTAEARSVLMGELTRRRIDVTENLEAHTDVEPASEKIRTRGLSFHADPPGVGGFVEEVLRIYRRHFWFFIRVIAPAVVVGYIAVLIGRNEGREIARNLPRGVGLLFHQTELIEIALANWAGYLVSWMAFSFSFGAICFAVSQIGAGAAPSFADSFGETCHRLGSFLRLSLLLFFLILLAQAAGGLLSGGIFWILGQRQIHSGRIAIWVVTFGVACIVLLLMSRFGLAIPALILDDYRVGQAMFRSDELTEKKWLTLAVLLAKSLIGGYVAGMSPFWLASFIPPHAQLPSWFPWVLTIVSIAGVTVVEPTMFIGFALLYLKNSPVLPPSRDVPNRQLA